MRSRLISTVMTSTLLAGAAIATLQPAASAATGDREMQTIGVRTQFAANSAKLTKADKRSLRQAIAKVDQSGASTRSQRLTIVAKASRSCGSAVDVRGDVRCNWRPLASARANRVAAYVRSQGFTGRITKRIKGLYGTGSQTRVAQATFRYEGGTPTPPKPAYSFTVVNNSVVPTYGDAGFATAMSVQYPCQTGSCTGQANAPSSPSYAPTNFQESVLQSSSTVTITVPGNVVLGLPPMISLDGTNSAATCTSPGTSTGATLMTVTCQVTADNAEIHINLLYQP